MFIELFKELFEIFMISLSILELVLSAKRGCFLTNPSPTKISLLSEFIEIGPIIENPYFFERDKSCFFLKVPSGFDLSKFGL